MRAQIASHEQLQVEMANPFQSPPGEVHGRSLAALAVWLLAPDPPSVTTLLLGEFPSSSRPLMLLETPTTDICFEYWLPCLTRFFGVYY